MFNRHIRTLFVAVAVVTLLAAAVPAVAGQSVERPIKEVMSGYLIDMERSPTFPVGDTFGGRCSLPSQWVSTSAGGGEMSHLGQVSWTLEQCFQLFAGSFGTFSDAEAVVTAANGDQLFGTFDGIMTGETTFAETLFITGGTGRFVGASGTIEETGWFDPDTGYMEVTGSGSIIYDASNRRSND